MKQIFNPYLPSYEYIPDGEPHIFNNRLYIYGSHDRFNGTTYCENDYVCWSAPVDDLSDWRFEGEIYNRKQHPHKEECLILFAPDVIQGPDGRYYLYYSVAHSSRMLQYATVLPDILNILAMLKPKMAEYMEYNPEIMYSLTPVFLWMMTAVYTFTPASALRKQRMNMDVLWRELSYAA